MGEGWAVEGGGCEGGLRRTEEVSVWRLTVIKLIEEITNRRLRGTWRRLGGRLIEFWRRLGGTKWRSKEVERRCEEVRRRKEEVGRRCEEIGRKWEEERGGREVERSLARKRKRLGGRRKRRCVSCH